MKLLQKTIRNYISFSALVLLIAIPVFYLVMQAMVKHDVDESLIATKEILRPKIANLLKNHNVEYLSFLDHDITVSVSSYKEEFDSFKTVKIYDSISDEMVPHRVLSSNLIINGNSYFLNNKLSMVDNESLIQSIVGVQALLMCILLIGLFLINKNLSIKIWKPFYKTIEALKDYKIDKHKTLDFTESDIDEFNELNKTLEALTERAHKTYNNQKEFAENASHELQTPLAIFQGKLELLMQTNPLTKDQAKLISDMADASQRMARLNKKLILLTKIESNQFPEMELIFLNAIVKELVIQLEPQIHAKNISCTVLSNADLHVNADRGLFEILLSNLIGNAIKHNINDGKIEILLEKDNLIVRNGAASRSLNVETIYQRFQKESDDTNSIGLGLEIVKKISELYGWDIKYMFENNMHQFKVLFK